MSEKVQAAVGQEKLDAVVCVAGGWAGGNAASPGITLCLLHTEITFHDSSCRLSKEL